MRPIGCLEKLSVHWWSLLEATLEGFENVNLFAISLILFLTLNVSYHICDPRSFLKSISEITSQSSKFERIFTRTINRKHYSYTIFQFIHSLIFALSQPIFLQAKNKFLTWLVKGFRADWKTLFFSCNSNLTTTNVPP